MKLAVNPEINALIELIEKQHGDKVPTQEAFKYKRLDCFKVFCQFCHQWHTHAEGMKTEQVDDVRLSHCGGGQERPYRVKSFGRTMTLEMHHDTRRKNPVGP